MEQAIPKRTHLVIRSRASISPPAETVRELRTLQPQKASGRPPICLEVRDRRKLASLAQVPPQDRLDLVRSLEATPGCLTGPRRERLSKFQTQCHPSEMVQNQLARRPGSPREAFHPAENDQPADKSQRGLAQTVVAIPVLREVPQIQLLRAVPELLQPLVNKVLYQERQAPELEMLKAFPVMAVAFLRTSILHSGSRSLRMPTRSKMAPQLDNQVQGLPGTADRAEG